MFLITEAPLSGSLVQCLAKNYKKDSIVSVDMDKVGVTEAYSDCTNTDLVHVNGHDIIILLIFCQALFKAPDDGSSVIRNMLEHF